MELDEYQAAFIRSVTGASRALNCADGGEHGPGDFWIGADLVCVEMEKV